MKNFFLLLLSLLASTMSLCAQDTTRTLTFSAYAETFWAYDANQPADNQRPAFLYSHNRHNEVNINLAYLKAAHTSTRTRANLALAVGTYIADNYAAEPQVLQNMLEANVGLKLGAKTWLDAGVLPSHIGFESAISKDCWALTRSLCAENSPYFETGARLTYTPNDRWTLAALLLNGWQRIARVNTTPAAGTQVQWKPSEHTTLNWSTYIGNEQPDTARAWRVFQNVYGIFQLSRRVGLTAGLDVGAQSDKVWFTPVLLVRTQLSSRWAMTCRAEHYEDRDGVITASRFSVTGGSLNLDFSPNEQAMLRFELRYLHSDQARFAGKNDFRTGSLYGTTSLAVSF